MNLTNPTEALSHFSSMMWKKNSNGSEEGILAENIVSLRSQ